MTELTARHVLVIGAGRTGAAVAGVLLRRGVPVTVLESGSAEARGAALELAAAGAQVVHDEADVQLDAFDLVVPSPGVPEHAPVLVAAAAANVRVCSEPELAWQLAAGRTRLVAVTGTNGKTTTTELLAACLGAPAGGNIGTPLVTLLDAQTPPPLVVAELSSFQLRFTDQLRPSVAVLLNVAPDHLDWHGSEAAYRSSKARIWQRQSGDDVVVVNADDPGAQATVEAHPPAGAVWSFTAGAPAAGQVGIADGMIVSRLGDAPVEVVRVADLGIAGPHNVANACAAVAAAIATGADPASLAAPLQAYSAGRHRLETVATIDGVQYVDDSKATNPHAAAAALAAYPQGRVVWIAGGLGKGLEFSSLQPLIERSVKAAMTIGTSGPAIAGIVRAAGKPVTEAGTLDAAVDAAAATATAGDVVLLAPACASMDQFTDYAERGDAFRAAVLARSAQGAANGR